jgi:hypothetical protein
MEKTLDYWHWLYFITRKWEYPDDVEAAKVIGFAIIMSTFGKKGTNIRPSAHAVARRANMTDRLSSHYRRRCIDLGLFRDTGETYHSIPILEISIPVESATVTIANDDPWDTDYELPTDEADDEAPPRRLATAANRGWDD